MFPIQELEAKIAQMKAQGQDVSALEKMLKQRNAWADQVEGAVIENLGLKPRPSRTAFLEPECTF